MPDSATGPSLPAGIDRDPNFRDMYANHTFFSPSAWDLQAVFAKIDQSTGTLTTHQLASVTIPWAQAKLAMYYLQVQILAHELEVGKIAIRKDLIPASMPELTAEQLTNPTAVKMRQAVEELRQEFIDSLA